MAAARAALGAVAVMPMMNERPSLLARTVLRRRSVACSTDAVQGPESAESAGCRRVASHPVRPGEADYGHWGETTVRLIFPSQVQVSPDNRSFHTLYDQGRACS